MIYMLEEVTLASKHCDEGSHADERFQKSQGIFQNISNIFSA